MPYTDVEVGDEARVTPIQNQTKSSLQELDAGYKLTQFETPFILVSLVRQIRQWLREPKVTVPPQYYAGEAELPVVEMRAWYKDLPRQLRQLPELTKYLVLRELKTLHLLPKSYQMPEAPDIWQDYKAQPGSWLNSLLVHALVLTAMILPFYIARMLKPAQAAPKDVTPIDISPYMAQLPASPKKAGGGGGGGDRTPAPPSKGNVPKFSHTQFTPPMAKVPNLQPKLPMTPTLLGPPELKLPQMADANFGDPHGVPGPPSNGPGTGGGIGTGRGTGVGEGTGGGLGPGSGGGTGGGLFSVGGNVSAPIPIYRPDPPYSEEARKAKYQGVVILWIVVDAQGNVANPRVVKPVGMGLDQKAVDTVKTWKFKPAMRGGVPVPVQVQVEVTFRLF